MIKTLFSGKKTIIGGSVLSNGYNDNGHGHDRYYIDQKVHHLRTRVPQRGQKYAIVGLTAGIAFGFMLCFWMKTSLLPCASLSKCCLKERLREEIKHEMLVSQAQIPPAIKRKQVLIGVMTAARFIDNRAMAVWKTWANTINGDVFFFSSEGTSLDSKLPIVAIPGVDDSYPPQKKSFMMVKYLHDFGIDKYEFFMRVDDDVYIHGKRLSNFLSQLNNTKPLFIGQAGTGSVEELGKLSLDPDQNFCMGGPGILFSAETLRRMVPHIGYCLQNLLTSHEDVELGRCVRMFAGIPCTFNYEMQKLFHHSYTYRTDRTVFPYVMTGSEVDQSITLHPVKSPEMMYKVHNEMLVRQKASESLLSLLITQDMNEMNSLLSGFKMHKSVSDYHPINPEEILSWQFFNKKSKFAHSTFSVQRNIEGSWKVLLTNAVNHMIAGLNNDAMEKGRILEYKETIYGFRRANPLLGLELIIDVLLDYKRIKGKFTKMGVKKRVHMQLPYGAPEIREISKDFKTEVNLVLPVSGKLEAFKRFLKNFEDVCEEDRHCKLIVVIYDGPDLTSAQDLVRSSTLSHLITTRSGKGEFSRAVSLHQGALSLSENSLMLFIDVDVHFNRQSLSRVRQHTIQGQQLYFPIVYSQYDSHMVCSADICPISDQTDHAGYYRYFGFGIASMYKEDYLRIGGFDLTIQGWGKEDVDLFSKVLKNSLTVFRAADPSLIHIYHPIICDSMLSEEQTVMCINSKATSYASKEQLAGIFFQTQNLDRPDV